LPVDINDYFNNTPIMPEEKEIKKRTRRTSVAIDHDVLQAVSSLIEEVGFSNVTLTGVAERAKIEPAVFYRRYGNLDELFNRYCQKYDFWQGDLIGNLPSNLSEKEVFSLIMKNLIHDFSKNKGMQQIIVWELSVDNPVTRRTARMRELVNEPVIRMLEKTFSQTDLDINTIASVIIAGVYYLILHRKRSKFCDVDFNKKEGKARLLNGVEELVTILFDYIAQQKRIEEIAVRLRKEGIPESVIEKCVHF
jgi:AcrR family transcriptional regulator